MDIKQSEISEKRPATSRSEAMRAAWAKRRANAGVGADWLAHPVCCCGCGARLEVAKNPEQQRSFKPGHDSALKSLLRKINRGEAKSEDIPQAARANLARIQFIQANPEFQKAFAHHPEQKGLFAVWCGCGESDGVALGRVRRPCCGAQ